MIETPRFCFRLDEDVETGHGWRNENHRIVVDRRGDLEVEILRECDDKTWAEKGRHPAYSYVWIWPVEEFVNSRGKTVRSDNVRTRDVQDLYPGFSACDDMESHFEFLGTPDELMCHLESLGLLRKGNEK